MPRQIGLDDETVVAGYGKRDKERQYRAKEKETHILRTTGKCTEYRTHNIDDVLEPDPKTGEARGFEMVCSKDWNDETKEWEGECLACDKGYDVKMRYIVSLIWLATVKGKHPKPAVNQPEHSVFFWDFAATTYAKLRDLSHSLKRADPPKKVGQVDLEVTCEDEGFQKINIVPSSMKTLCSAAYVTALKEEGQGLIDEWIKAPSLEDQKRRLKPPTKKATSKGDADEIDLDEEEPKPSGGKRKAAAKRKPESDEIDLDDDAGEAEEEEKPAPKPAGKKAAAKRKPEPEPEAEEGETGADDIDAMLDDLEDE